MWPASRFFHKLSLSLCHLKHQQQERDETCKTKPERSTSIQIFTQWTHRNIWCAIHGAFSQICEHDATYFCLPTLYLLVWLCMHVLFHTFAVLLHTKPNLTVGDRVWGRAHLSSSTTGFPSNVRPVCFLHWTRWRVTHWPCYATLGL